MRRHLPGSSIGSDWVRLTELYARHAARGLSLFAHQKYYRIA